VIEVSYLVKKYDTTLAVDDLSFTIEPGKIYGFLGPNGAGKSTTMNIMTGYLGATSGDVIVNGHNILDEPEEAKKSIGYLPEMPPLYLDMRVREYLEFVAEIKGISKDKRGGEIARASKMTGVSDMSERLIKNLSKGYRQRVGMAQAILGSPEVIILDEPTVGLDPKQIIEIRKMIRDLSKDHTVILSSHILAEVQEICDYIMIISKGKLVASDTPDKLEKLVQGTETVEIATRAGESAVKEILKTVDGVSDYKVGKDDDGNTTAVIEAEENAEIAEKIFFAFAEKKTALRKLNETKASLEDVFLELTKSEAEDTAPEAAKPDKKALPEDAEDADDKEEEEATDDESDL